MGHGLKNTLFISLFLLKNGPSAASFDAYPAGAREMSMGMAAAAVGAGSEALFGNPASLLHVQGLHVHLSVCHPFAMNDLVYQNASAAIPVCRGIVGIGFQSMGCTLYQERTWVIGAAGTVAGRFRCGAALRLLRLRIERYGEAASSCIDFGALVGIGAGLSLGVSCHNATRARLNDEQPVPRTLQIGLSKMLFNTLLVTIQVAKDDAFPIEIRAGAEFNPIRPLFFRFGFVHQSSCFCFGIGLRLGSCDYDYALNVHPVLGLTHQASISWSVLKKRDH